jgi:hypothetical protein
VVIRLNTLDRLKQELLQTRALLSSPRVSETTRYVLERLQRDLEEQIATLESRLATDRRTKLEKQIGTLERRSGTERRAKARH